MIAGDDKYAVIGDLAPEDPYGLADEHDGRTAITDDYAYFSEYFLTGAVNGSVPPTEPRSKPGSSSPSKVDYLSTERIGATLLVSLVRQTGTIRDFSGSFSDVPRMGMSFADVADIFSMGANFIIPDLTLTIHADYSITLPMLYENYIRKDSLIESGLFDPSTTGFFIGSVSSNRGITGKDGTAAKKGAKE